MALRDTSWALDTSRAFIDSRAIVTSGAPTQETLCIQFGADTNTIYTRTHTIVTKEWICMTYAGAKAAADTRAGDTGHRIKYVEDNRYTGAYKLLVEVDSRTDWSTS